MSGKNKALSFVVFASHSARLECLHLTNTSPMLQKLCRLFQTKKPAIENGLHCASPVSIDFDPSDLRDYSDMAISSSERI